MTAPVGPGLVLVCDDDPDALAALRRVLLAGGFPVVTTTHPREALDILAREDVRVLLSDVDMPEMDGNRLVAEALRIRPHAVRMLLTGRANLAAAVSGINDGEVFRFMTKPWNPDALIRAVGEALARSLELELAAETGRAAAERRRTAAELEARHPGITDIDRDADGVYLARADQTAALIEAPALGGLLDADGD